MPAPYTRAQLAAEIAAQLPDNTTGNITPVVVRGVLTDISNSAYNQADDSGLLANPWSSITGHPTTIAGYGITDYVPFTGDAGAGGTVGIVPAPPAGSASYNSYLSADGSFEPIPYKAVPLTKYASLKSGSDWTAALVAAMTAESGVWLPIGETQISPSTPIKWKNGFKMYGAAYGGLSVSSGNSSILHIVSGSGAGVFVNDDPTNILNQIEIEGIWFEHNIAATHTRIFDFNGLNGSRIRNCKIYINNNTTGGFRTQQIGGQVSYSNSFDGLVINSQQTNNAYLFDVDFTDSEVLNCNFTSGLGVKSNSAQARWIGCSFFNLAWSTGGMFNYFTASGDKAGFQIIGCHFDGGNGGIVLNWGAGATNDDMTVIVGNHFRTQDVALVGSTTSMTVGMGSVTFTVDTNASVSNFIVGTRVRIAKKLDGTVYMAGAITAYTGTSMTVNVDTTAGGPGPFASWAISYDGMVRNDIALVNTSGSPIASGPIIGSNHFTSTSNSTSNVAHLSFTASDWPGIATDDNLCSDGTIIPNYKPVQTVRAGVALGTQVSGQEQYTTGGTFVDATAGGSGQRFVAHRLRQAADHTLTSTTALQKAFDQSANGAFTASVRTYRFCMFLAMSSLSGSAGDVKIGFGGTATYTVNLIATGIKDTATGTGNVTPVNVLTAVSVTPSNTNTAAVIRVEGEIVVTVAGTIIPQVGLGVAAAAKVLADSFVEFIPIEQSALGNFT